MRKKDRLFTVTATEYVYAQTMTGIAPPGQDGTDMSAYEPQEAGYLTVSRTGWRTRLIFNTRSNPFPYLFRPWSVDSPQGYCTSGSRGYVGDWITEWDRLEWQDWFAAHPDGAGPEVPRPVGTCVPWVVHADIDKAHRCPVCRDSGGIQDQMTAYGYPWRNRHVFTCTRCGQRFAWRWYLPSYPHNGDTLRNRVAGWSRHLGYKLEGLYPWWGHTYRQVLPDRWIYRRKT